MEHAFCKDFSLKFECRYIDLGKRNVEGQLFFSDGRPSGETFKTDVDADFHTLRVGINYKFGDRTEPIVSVPRQALKLLTGSMPCPPLDRDAQRSIAAPAQLPAGRPEDRALQS